MQTDPDSPSQDILSDDPFRQPAQVLSIPLSRVVPDRFQARLALPPKLKSQFFSGEIDCYEVARLLLAAADSDPGLFRLVNDLRILGHSILTERQIDPATGMWVDADGGEPVFLLETGERRFWSLALEAVTRGMEEEPELKVIPQPGNSRQRQTAENFLREDLCAVEMGKAIATMVLENLDIYPEPQMDEMFYYRQALQISRLPSGTWPEIERVTGYSRPVLYRHLRILSLADDLLYLATLYRLPESILRDIVIAPKDAQRKMVLAAIEERTNQTSDPGASDSVIDGRQQQFKPDIQTHQNLARRTQSLLRQLARQVETDGDLGEVASELSVLLDLDGVNDAAGMLEALAAKLRIIQRRRKQ